MRRNQQWSPENLALCPPMLGSREGMFPLGGSFTLPVQQDTKVFNLSGVDPPLWRLESLWLRDGQLLCFSCRISNIHTCIEEQPEPFLSSLWWYQRQKEYLDLKQNFPLSITVGFILYPSSRRKYNPKFQKTVPCQIFCKHPKLQALTRFAVW